MSPNGPVIYRMAKAGLDRPLRALYRLDVNGLGHLDDDGPLILAANHRSFMDSIFLAMSSPRPISFIAKAEYFDHRLSRWALNGAGQIPLRRGSPRSARQAMDAAAAVLRRGGVVGVYPEGTRSRDGKLHRGNLAPARLAAATGAPIVPIGLIGTEHVQKPTERLPRPFRTIAVRVGEPRQVMPSTDAADTTKLRAATDELMLEIAELSGQQQVDHFAPVPAPRRAST